MSVLILSVSTQESFMLMIFKMNQSHIAAHHCKNLDNPEAECNGTCFLNEKMKEAHDHKKEDPIPFTHNEKPNLVLFATVSENPFVPKKEKGHTFPLTNEYPDDLLWSSRLFRPPIV